MIESHDESWIVVQQILCVSLHSVQVGRVIAKQAEAQHLLARAPASGGVAANTAAAAAGGHLGVMGER